MFRKKIDEVLQGEDALIKRVSIPVETPRLATDEEIKKAKMENDIKAEHRKKEREERQRAFQSIRQRHGLGIQKTKDQIWKEGREQLLGFINNLKNQKQSLEFAVLERNERVLFLEEELEKREMPEQEIKKLKSEFEAEIKKLKISLSENTDGLQRAEREKEVMEDKFRDLLLSKELLDREDLSDKPLDLLLELWKEKAKLLSPKKEFETNEEKSDSSSIENRNICDFCGKPKHVLAKECESCRKRVESIRVGKGCSILEAREIFREMIENE